MNQTLNLLSFADVELKKMPQKARVEYLVEQKEGDQYQIVAAPIVLKDNELLPKLYYNYDQLTLEEQLYYQSKEVTFQRQKNGLYELETRPYVFQKKKKQSFLESIVKSC